MQIHIDHYVKEFINHQINYSLFYLLKIMIIVITCYQIYYILCSIITSLSHKNYQEYIYFFNGSLINDVTNENKYNMEIQNFYIEKY